MDHRKMQGVKLKDSLIIKLSYIKLRNGFITIYLYHQIWMQRRVFWLVKQIFSPCWMKVVWVLLLKCEDSHWTKAHKYLWHHNLFGHPSSLHQHWSEQPLNDPSQIISPLLVTWTQIHQQYCYSWCNLFRSSFLPLWMLGTNTNKGGRGVE